MKQLYYLNLPEYDDVKVTNNVTFTISDNKIITNFNGYIVRYGYIPYNYYMFDVQNKRVFRLIPPRDDYNLLFWILRCKNKFSLITEFSEFIDENFDIKKSEFKVVKYHGKLIAMIFRTIKDNNYGDKPLVYNNAVYISKERFEQYKPVVAQMISNYSQLDKEYLNKLLKERKLI